MKSLIFCIIKVKNNGIEDSKYIVKLQAEKQVKNVQVFQLNLKS